MVWSHRAGFIPRVLPHPSSQVLAAAAAKSLQSCPTLCDPIGGSPPGSPSLGFSRQEHWSGLPFPSPMHESEKWKWCRSVVSDSSQPHGLRPTRLLRPWDFPGKSTGVGCHCLLRRSLLLHGKHLWFFPQFFKKDGGSDSTSEFLHTPGYNLSGFTDLDLDFCLFSHWLRKEQGNFSRKYVSWTISYMGIYIGKNSLSCILKFYDFYWI